MTGPGGDPPGKSGTAFGVFLERRRAAAKESSQPPGNILQLQREWRLLSGSQKAEYEKEAEARRAAAAPEAASQFLKRQKEALAEGPPRRARMPDKGRETTTKRRRQQSPPRVPCPFFPAQELESQPARQDLAKSLREQVEDQVLHLPSSAAIDLTKVDSHLRAPTLTSDLVQRLKCWEVQDLDDSEDEGLEVSLPPELEARNYLRQQLLKQVSSCQVHRLVNECVKVRA